MSKIIIDKRSDECAYITVGTKTVYVDDSTNESIVNIWEGEATESPSLSEIVDELESLLISKQRGERQ